MLFSSVIFLYMFLPAVLILYLISPARFRNGILLAASLFFYFWGEPKLIVLLMAEVLWTYGAGFLLVKTEGAAKRLVSVISLSIPLGCLFLFKYYNFFLESFNSAFGSEVPALGLTLPLGISFYTFQMVSYLADVSRGSQKPRKKLTDLALYVTMFPQLVAGPIVRYETIAGELESREVNDAQIREGIVRFIHGLVKKVLLADNLGRAAAVFSEMEYLTMPGAWMLAVGFMLQIYYDFSGYSDMAIGLGSMFGFHFPENFDHPYLSTSVTEFWRRWHMTLGSWFRDYVYIPLGGNRVGKARFLFNILFVWMLTGLWHGSSWNFLCWGIYFAFFLLLEKLILKPGKNLFGHLYTLFVVMVGFIIFRNEALSRAWLEIRALTGAFGAAAFPGSETVYAGQGGLSAASAVAYYCKSYLALYLISAAGIIRVVSEGFRRLERHRVIGAGIALAGLLFVTASMIDSSFQPFLYFRF